MQWISKPGEDQKSPLISSVEILLDKKEAGHKNSEVPEVCEKMGAVFSSTEESDEFCSWGTTYGVFL